MVTPTAYAHISEPHLRACKQLELNLSFFLWDMGSVDVYDIRSRIKEFASAMEKSEKLGIPIHELDDIAGIRLIVGTTNEIPIVERFFTRQEYGKDLKVLKRRELDRKDGYNALHLVVELNSSYQRSMYPGRVEVQVHTVFSHAFNFLSRSWKYKHAVSTSDEWQEKFVLVSETLVAIESSASELHRQLVSATCDSIDGALTPHTLKALIQQEFREDRPIDDLVDECRMYSDVGYKTIGALRALYRNGEVAELYEKVQNASHMKSVSYFSTMPKSMFWQMFGLRIGMPGTVEFVDGLIKQAKNVDAARRMR